MRATMGPDLGASLETVCYHELVARGFMVYTGEVGKEEIDFVAIRDKKKYYFQVSYLLHNKETEEREFRSLKKVEDQFPKFVVSLDDFDMSRDGIVHLHMIDLLENFEEILQVSGHRSSFRI